MFVTIALQKLTVVDEAETTGSWPKKFTPLGHAKICHVHGVWPVNLCDQLYIVSSGDSAVV